jgi:hypothetical protein
VLAARPIARCSALGVHFRLPQANSPAPSNFIRLFLGSSEKFEPPFASHCRSQQFVWILECYTNLQDLGLTQTSPRCLLQPPAASRDMAGRSRLDQT